MPGILVFDLRSKMAHFRLPDTTVTHASYPFIPRTTLHGLLASILGLESLDGLMNSSEDHEYEPEHLVGLRLMAPVKSSFQKVSMLGKGWAGSSSESFNKPVSLEIIVEPHYRIYYSGPYLHELEDKLKSRQSKYHTYMGSCYCLVFPQYISTRDATEISSVPGLMTTQTVVPSFMVERLVPQPGCEYARAGGLHYRYLGGRQFSGTLNMVYEVAGKPMVFAPRGQAPESQAEPLVRFFELDGGETICMW